MTSSSATAPIVAITILAGPTFARAAGLHATCRRRASGLLAGSGGAGGKSIAAANKMRSRRIEPNQPAGAQNPS